MSASRMCARVLVLSSFMLSLASPAWSGAVLKPNGADAMPIFTRSVTARAEISGQFARTTLVMVFQNESEDQVEADFIYALPPGAVATYFAYWAGDEKVEAKIVEKKEAARIYQHLTAYARDPALVEFTGKNTFRARISPVFADQDLKVEIRYVQVLPSSGDSVGYSVPIGPSTKQPDPLESVDAVILVKKDARIRSVSNNYGVPVAKDSGHYQVVIKGQDYRPPKDLTVRIYRSHRPLRAELRAEPGNGHFSLALTPDRSLKHPRVRISGVQVTQIAPARLRDVRAGQSIAVFGRYRSGGKARVTLTGQSSSGMKAYSVPVDFSAASSSGIASKLWAAARMWDLGRKRSNRKTIIGLSFGYSLPSRYTSWLAVPKAETERLEHERVSARIWELAQPMAELIAEGKQDSTKYRTLKAEYDILLQPSAARDSEELIGELWLKKDEAICKFIELRNADKPDATAVSRWKARAERVSKEIIRLSPGSEPMDIDQELDRQEGGWLMGQCREIAEKLARLTMNGKSSSDEARRLKARYNRLLERVPVRYAATSADQLAKQARSAANEVASKLVNERHKPHPSKSALNDLQLKLKRISPSAGISPDEALQQAEENWARMGSWPEAEAYANAVAQGKTKEAETHLRRYEKLSKAAGVKNPDRLLSSRLRDAYYWAVYGYYHARTSGTCKPAELKRLRDKADRLAKLTGGSVDADVKEYAAGDAASEAADRLYDTASSLTNELGRGHPIRSRVDRLRKTTGALALEIKNADPNYDRGMAGEDYNAAADQAIAAWLEEQKVKAQAQTGAAGQEELDKAAELRAAAQENLETNLHYIRSSIRGGDPLISVEAPQDALWVIALLPDGDVKVLEWNPTNCRWEARFDVPTGTPDGDYIVRVVVILSDGTRKLSSVNYKVDNTPPTGSATAVLCDNSRTSLRLEVEPDEDLARIVALLPWGERVELRKSSESDLYAAIVQVPTASAAGKIELILTDNAHNRASILVDPDGP